MELGTESMVKKCTLILTLRHIIRCFVLLDIFAMKILLIQFVTDMFVKMIDMLPLRY